MANNKTKPRKKKKTFLILAAVLIIVLIVVFSMQADREKSIDVAVEKVQKENLTSIISASGEVSPKKNVNISAQIPGRIMKIGVEEGQMVKAGDFLLNLESTQYEANAERDRALISGYNAELIKAAAYLKRDESNYNRQKKLFDDQLISSESLEAALATYEVSKAQYESIQYQIKQAEASLESSLDNLSKTVYSSPIDGIITSLRIEEGEIALVGTMNNPGTVLMSIADLSVMEVEVEVDETDVIGIKIGQKAEVRVDAFPDLTISGKVTEIGSSALQQTAGSQESKDFKVVITLLDPPENLKPGLTASSDIITAREEGVLAVPISALVLREKEEEEEGSEEKEQDEGVYVVQDSRVKFHSVEKGILGELKIEIKSGLEEGQEIVVGPYSALRILKDDTKVKPAENKQEQ
jgi:HlyD family secretion protein